ncbi:MAG: peptide-methionine (S)-S-oxide reductase, partial [Candidatus Eisenbacteria bacterium]
MNRFGSLVFAVLVGAAAPVAFDTPAVAGAAAPIRPAGRVASASRTGPATARVAAVRGESAIFAGGCFWCLETAYEGRPGVLSAVSGYSGGKELNPTYEQVSSHATSHLEVVEVRYDPAKISYAQLLDLFWHSIDPTQGDGQF